MICTLFFQLIIFSWDPYIYAYKEMPHSFSQVHSIPCLDEPQLSQSVPYWLIFMMFLFFGKEQENCSSIYLLWCFRIIPPWNLASSLARGLWVWELAQVLESSKGLQLFIGVCSYLQPLVSCIFDFFSSFRLSNTFVGCLFN